MIARFAMPLLALGLAACGSEAEEPKTVEQVAAEMQKLPPQMPGLYRITSEIIEIDVAELSPEQAELMRQKSDVKPDVNEQCVTQEEADKSVQDIVKGISEASGAGNCSFAKFAVTGTRLDSQMTCTGPMGTGGDVAIAGVVEETGLDLIMDMTIDASVMGEIGMKMKITSERIGDCPA
ncbi:DUF3617 domain-containing protein [Pontixanthobacter sp.]|uniref:DUF3617 domain-containing protein n=1 Tax=Pontixanthobacter sp. TaxID=2792078 RepID=UPI003C7973F2